MPEFLDYLTRTIQHNCDIADARHGGAYTMCTYLMKMREYYRWEMRLPFGALLPKDDLGDWLQRRETLWEQLADADFQPLTVDGATIDPFDSETVNRTLIPRGLVYSGGLGSGSRPHFFLGRLHRHDDRRGFSILISDQELARDLGSPPAMATERTVFLRRESLRRLLWERLETWRWSRPRNALARAFACYRFEDDLEGALEVMTEEELDAACLHEVGEVLAGDRLGDQAWNDMLADLPHSRAELAARAVRDHLADCLSTLPALADGGRAASLHFLVGSLSGMRKELFPALASAYQAWHEDGDWNHLRQVAARGADHWFAVGRQMLELHHGHAEAAVGPIDALVDRSRL